MIPEALLYLLDDQVKAYAFLATIKKDGTPQVTPVWFRWDGKHVIINTAEGRLKDRNMARNPNVALAIPDPGNPGCYLQIQGRIISRDTTSGNEEINRLSFKYTGNPEYQWQKPGETRVTYRIEPLRVEPQN